MALKQIRNLTLFAESQTIIAYLMCFCLISTLFKTPLRVEFPQDYGDSSQSP